MMTTNTQVLETTLREQGLIFKTFAAGPLGCNCSILGDPQTKQALLIDPGGDAEHIIELLEADQLTLTMIVHTHGHFDHILASGVMKTYAPEAPLAIHKQDLWWWEMVGPAAERFGIQSTALPHPDHWLEDEEQLVFGQCYCQVLHTPGHTEGSVCFLNQAHQLLIAGDTLFRGSIGRTDLPGGELKTIIQSIKQRLYTLNETTTVIPGHGPLTVIGDEMRHNAFVKA